jgi:hypothetical protein
MSAPPFKPGERIAVPYLPILRVENGVAVLKKTRLGVWAECGARHRVRVETPFLVRGGFRVEQKTMYKVPSSAVKVKYRDRTGEYTINLPRLDIYIDSIGQLDNLAKRLLKKELGRDVEVVDVELVKEAPPVAVYARRFKHVEVVIPQDGYFIHFIHFGEYSGDTYFVYEFVNNENEAKLVDDASRIDYVLHIIGHSESSRAGCAKIKILSGDIVWSDVKSTCCRITSSAVAMIIAKFGSRIAVARNELPYRGCCEEWIVEEWESVVPPRLVTSYRSTDPVTSNTTPEDVV